MDGNKWMQVQHMHPEDTKTMMSEFVICDLSSLISVHAPSPSLFPLLFFFSPARRQWLLAY